MHGTRSLRTFSTLHVERVRARLAMKRCDHLTKKRGEKRGVKEVTLGNLPSGLLVQMAEAAHSQLSLMRYVAHVVALR